MIASALTFGLIGLASAGPLAFRQVKPNYPSKATSKGFNLVVNVTEPSADFSPSIQNSFVTTIHTGAGLALVGVNAQRGPVFYQNGTAEEQHYGQATVVTDAGTPETPAGLKLNKAKDDGAATAGLDFGYGTPGIQLSAFPEPYSYLVPETFIACNESLEYYQGQHFIIIKHADVSVSENGTISHDVPENCAAVRLLPQCANLADLSKDAYASHDYALDSQCYDNVAELQWGQYGPE